MQKALVIGNGESRSWYKPHTSLSNSIVTWGCNAIYRDGDVDNLVAIDYGMQQEIYDSKYYKWNTCWFADWSVLPAEVAEMSLMGFDLPPNFIHRSKNKTANCVIQGKDPATIQQRIDSLSELNANLDMNDLQKKLTKDIGVWITYVEEDDNVTPIDFPVGWSAGCTALYLACQGVEIEEIYILGYDLSSYEDTLNNLYKGTDNYLPATAKGFNSTNWMNQMATVFKEFSDKQFYWVDRQLKEKLQFNNVKDLTKDELCDKLHIL